MAGRPSSFNEDLANNICEWISEGNSLTSFCKKEGMPSITTIMNWLIKGEQGIEPYNLFLEQYTRAMDIRADVIAEQCIDISDTENAADVARAKLRIDTRKWYAGKLKPKKYGDKLNLGGDADNPIVHKTIDDKEAIIAKLKELGLPTQIHEQ